MDDETINIGAISPAKPSLTLLSASTLISDDVYNRNGEKLGSIKDLMIDLQSGRVCYAVLSFGGFLTMGEKVVCCSLKRAHGRHRKQAFSA
jgi:hypothetical protein